MNASIHPPNELSLPRCYQDNQNARINTKSTPSSPYSRSISMDPLQRNKANLSPRYKMSGRPKLKRETAQDFEDGDVQIDPSSDQRSMHTLSPNIHLKQGKQKHLIHQKSAPGTPMSPKRFTFSNRTPSRTPSDESSTSGYLSVPKQRLRGSSFSGDTDLSSRCDYIIPEICHYAHYDSENIPHSQREY